ncbi:MAG TPA: FtsX-like permease family protein, partial [Puia sp.]|nr:FtsX-like permease family protein [Puia sp.]
DDRFASLYTSEQRTGEIFSLFAAIAILIACLGLSGLVAFTTQQRTKEIGVRKVLGASVRQVLFLLSGEYLKLVLIAFCIAAPLSWWAMRGWLNNFAYRITIGWWVFTLAGVLGLFIAVLTLSYQTLRASLANPVDALRTE